VLAVGAVGQLGAFPSGSGIAAQMTGPPTADGLFAPRFVNHGPGLDCCAPGAAVVSGLPPASYGPLDGTGIAAAHVAAAAVLDLAHHPQFRPERHQPTASRDEGRVDRLFQLILASCRPLPAIGPLRSGLGLPSLPAVDVAPWGTRATAPGSSAHPAIPSAAARTPVDPLGQHWLRPPRSTMPAAARVRRWPTPGMTRRILPWHDMVRAGSVSSGESGRLRVLVPVPAGVGHLGNSCHERGHDAG
jgi:hypothetical protein